MRRSLAYGLFISWVISNAASASGKTTFITALWKKGVGCFVLLQWSESGGFPSRQIPVVLKYINDAQPGRMKLDESFGKRGIVFLDKLSAQKIALSNVGQLWAKDLVFHNDRLVVLANAASIHGPRTVPSDYANTEAPFWNQPVLIGVTSEGKLDTSFGPKDETGTARTGIWERLGHPFLYATGQRLVTFHTYLLILSTDAHDGNPTSKRRFGVLSLVEPLKGDPVEKRIKKIVARRQSVEMPPQFEDGERGDELPKGDLDEIFGEPGILLGGGIKQARILTQKHYDYSFDMNLITDPLGHPRFTALSVDEEGTVFFGGTFINHAGKSEVFGFKNYLLKKDETRRGKFARLLGAEKIALSQGPINVAFYPGSDRMVVIYPTGEGVQNFQFTQHFMSSGRSAVWEPDQIDLAPLQFSVRRNNSRRLIVFGRHLHRPQFVVATSMELNGAEKITREIPLPALDDIDVNSCPYLVAG